MRCQFHRDLWPDQAGNTRQPATPCLPMPQPILLYNRCILMGIFVMALNPCTTSSCGRMIYIYPEKNLRAYLGVARGSEEWDGRYNIRTFHTSCFSVEAYPQPFFSV